MAQNLLSYSEMEKVGKERVKSKNAEKQSYLNALTTYGDNLCFRQCHSEREFNLDQSLLLCNRSLLNRFVAWHQTIQEHVPALTAFKRVMLPLFLKPVKFTFGVATAAINWWKELRRKYCNPSLLQVFPMHRRWVISVALYNVRLSSFIVVVQNWKALLYCQVCWWLEWGNDSQNELHNSLYWRYFTTFIVAWKKDFYFFF